MTWEQRLRAGIRVNPVTGCRLWTRAKNSKGYGVLWAEGRLHLTHRLAFRAKHGRWPSMLLDHIVCDTPACCNADHVVESTNSANIMRAYPRGDERTERRRALNRAAKARQRARRSAK